MADKHTAIPVEEIARRGNEIYERKVCPLVEAGNHGKVVAIDIHTEDYALGSTGGEAAEVLRQQRPDAEVWLVRVGHASMYSIGYGPRTSGG
jgi:hypothetical protein